MNTSSLPRALLVVALATLVALGSAVDAHASPKGKPASYHWHAPKLLPKVRFKAEAKLSLKQARVSLRALVTFAGKTLSIPVFDMGLRKTKKSVRITRKIGKLRVALKVSWSGTRTITIKGTARYLKFKVPVPRIKIHV
jgi:hypothetical protein